jgi:hypothetical protein
VRSSPKENQSLEVKVKGISEMEFSLSIFDYTFTNYQRRRIPIYNLERELIGEAWGYMMTPAKIAFHGGIWLPCGWWTSSDRE